MKIVRAADCQMTPWKNGGGSTTEIAVAPGGASLDDFNWRVSMAHVATDGPFSEFAGIDRTLAVVGGDGLVLTIGTAAPVRLDPNSEPVRFAGDTPTSARLTGGEITDLNVMTRRGRFEHRLQRVREAAHCDFDGHDTAVVVACSGSIALTVRQHEVVLTHGDAAIMTPAVDAEFRIRPAAPGVCYLALLRECLAHPG